MSGCPARTLVRYFHRFLTQEPPSLPPVDQSNMEVAYLLIDGLSFGRWFVLLVYRQSGNLVILRVTVAGREAAGPITKDLLWLKELGYHFPGIVSDGSRGILRAIAKVFPHIPHQACLAHLHRDAVNALGRYPKMVLFLLAQSSDSLFAV